MKINVHFFCSLCFCYISAQSQILYSNGALVYIDNGAVVQSNGGVEVANSGTLTNNGSLTITKNSTLPSPGNFKLSSGALALGNGLYKVEQDWVNDATFTANNSQVELFGNTQQFITSNTGVATAFNQLILTGTGTGNNRKKSLQGVNASVGVNGLLTLNDRELETQTNTFFVLNPSTAAVTNNTTPGSEGFVSSVSPGTFSRETNAASAYVFPTGSSNGVLRYRPVEITPLASSPGAYTARLNNNDPNTDGFNRAMNDQSMCLINNLFYHSIERTAGNNAADITLNYIASADGNWAALGHWRNTSANWNDMNTVTPSTSGVFNNLKRSGWLFANPGHPYALTNLRPAQPSISCPVICENSSNNTFSLTGSSSNYQWTVPSNGTIVSGQGTDHINVDWTTGTSYVYVYAVASPGCFSLPDSCSPSVFATPVAQFTATSGGSFGDSYVFTDLSAGGNSWSWNFGDGNSSSSQNPSHDYAGAGTYTVLLTVSNGGCSDTASYVIVTSEGINIPNVFTPNGDGANDTYFIKTSNLKEYKLSIYNRWGQLLFSSEDPSEKWDGTQNGKVCNTGTYFFILTAKSDTKDYSTNGYISLIN